MNTKSSKPALALIAGPTASGKSAAAIRLAQARGGVVINADASQVYADLRILTARPDAAEEARVPHRLFGHVDAADAGYSAARWAAEARAAIDAVHAEGRLPILVGGTGLYLRTLIDGIAPVPAIDSTIREIVRALPVAEAHRLLAIEDPAAAGARNDVPADAPIRRAIGVPPIAALLQGAIDRAAALAAIRLDTRRYAKRQYTWFRHQPPTDRVNATDSVDLENKIAHLLR